MNTKLIMLENPILVSDEEITSTNDWYLNGIRKPEKCTKVFLALLKHNKTTCPKIIAGIPEMPSIDFSALSEANCKKIGWVNFLKIAREYAYNKWRNYCDRENPTPEQKEKDLFTKILGIEGSVYDYMQGAQYAQSLNEKKFSEEDLKDVFNRGRLFQQTSCVPFDKEAAKEVFAQVVQSLSQPKVFDVEVEKEPYTVGEMSKLPLGTLNEKIKITNGSIKILKVL